MKLKQLLLSIVTLFFLVGCNDNDQQIIKRQMGQIEYLSEVAGGHARNADYWRRKVQDLDEQLTIEGTLAVYTVGFSDGALFVITNPSKPSYDELIKTASQSFTNRFF